MRTKMCNFKINFLILQWTKRFPIFCGNSECLPGNYPMSPVLPLIVQDFFVALLCYISFCIYMPSLIIC